MIQKLDLDAYIGVALFLGIYTDDLFSANYRDRNESIGSGGSAGWVIVMGRRPVQLFFSFSRIMVRIRHAHEIWTKISARGPDALFWILFFVYTTGNHGFEGLVPVPRN